MTAMSGSVRRLTVGDLVVDVASDGLELGRMAADDAEATIASALAHRGEANVMLATGNSQLAFLAELVRRPVDWSRVVVFHMDEYLGMGGDHPASFGRYIRERVADVVRPKATHYVDGCNPGGGEAECSRYAALLGEHPVDLCCLGIGENGHLAFNDPPVADFADALDVKVVELDEACRRQQVGEGHFATMADVPTHAITVTIPALLRAGRVLAIVPEARKAEAVRRALVGPVGTACPATALRSCGHARLLLDAGSASRLVG
jgi:glucosamine-6-phosphate deaminase